MALYLQARSKKESLLYQLCKKTLEKIINKTWHHQYIDILCSHALGEPLSTTPTGQLDVDDLLYELTGDVALLEHIISRDYCQWDLMYQYAEICHKTGRTPIAMQGTAHVAKKNIALFEQVMAHWTGECDLSDYVAQYGEDPSVSEDIALLFSLGIPKEALVLPSFDTMDSPLKATNHMKLQYIMTGRVAVQKDIEWPRDLPDTVAHPVDDQWMLRVFQKMDSNTIAGYYEALEMVMYGLERRPKHVVMRLWAVELLALFGHPHCIAVYDSLEIKNIQVDMLSSALFTKLNLIGRPSDALRYSKQVLDLEHQNERETPEMIGQAYMKGTLVNVMEFMRFEDRLSNSLTRYLAQTETIRSVLLTGGDLTIRDLSHCRQDNRDTKVYEHALPLHFDAFWCDLWHAIYAYQSTKSLDTLAELPLEGIAATYRDAFCSGVLGSFSFRPYNSFRPCQSHCTSCPPPGSL